VPPIRVANPLTTEQGAMRTSVLAGLLRNVRYNLDRGADDLRLYELGRVYLPAPGDEEGPLAWPVAEPRRLGLIATGRRSRRHWSLGKAADDPGDFHDIKGAVEDVLAALRIGGAEYAPAGPLDAPFLHPASACLVTIGGQPAGLLGEVHPQVAAHFEVPARLVLAELDWELLAAGAQHVATSRGVPRFPPLSRDLAFVVDDAVPAARMVAEIRAADEKGLLESVLLFDRYKGAPVPEGKTSLAYALTLRAPDRTLTDAEADALCAAVVARVTSRLGAQHRA